MRNKIIIFALAILAIGGGYVWYLDQDNESEETIKDEETARMAIDSEEMIIGYQGAVLAGTKSLLLDFNKLDFEEALASDKLVVLYFYANWCPICRAEFPRMQAAFNELESDKIIAFRVNYNDDQTDDDEVALAREYGVAYQHTKVFIKNGQRVLKSPESWDKSRYFEEISKHD